MVRFERKHLIQLLAFLAAISIGVAHADIVVPSTSDIWLAGQPSGASVAGFFGTDSVPANSPIPFVVGGGDILTFSITGYTPVSVDGSCFDSTADAGACYADEFGFSPGSANGISLAHVPAGALVGVFLAAGGPSGPTPPALDFTGATNFSALSPLLDQLFFIGDGLTGTGTGTAQRFTAPAGATTLYLAVSDSLGASGNNLGSITVDAVDLGIAPVPEPSTAVFMLTMMAALLVLVRTHAKSSK
jgi:hypothetical protein